MLILMITVRVSYTSPSRIMVALVARILLGYVLLCSLTFVGVLRMMDVHAHLGVHAGPRELSLF